MSEKVHHRRYLVSLIGCLIITSCFGLVPKSMTLNDLERCNGPYFALFTESGSFRGAYCVKVVEE